MVLERSSIHWLGEDISEVIFTLNVIRRDDLSCNTFSDSMECNSDMLLLQYGVLTRCILNHSKVVSKNLSRLHHRNAPSDLNMYLMLIASLLLYASHKTQLCKSTSPQLLVACSAN